MKENIMKYLIDTYDPESIITYGSYADGTANEHSDFDALIIAESPTDHDSSVICGITLDVFIYPAQTFLSPYDHEDFIQVHDGVIELDKHGAAEKLIQSIRQYIDQLPAKSREEILQETAWCKKMLLRTEREDAEGYFRWHWLLADSLQIYFDVLKKRYFGPKKALKYLAQHDTEAYDKYETALRSFDRDTLTIWIDHVARRAVQEEG